MTLDELMDQYGWRFVPDITEQDRANILRIFKKAGRERVHRIAVIDAQTPKGMLPDLELLADDDVVVHGACGWFHVPGGQYDAWYDINWSWMKFDDDVILGLQLGILRGKAQIGPTTWGLQ